MPPSNKIDANRGNIIFTFVYIYSAFVLIRPHEYIKSLMGYPILPVLLICGAVLWIMIGRKAFFISQQKLIILFLFILSLSPVLKGSPGEILNVFAKFFPTVILYFLIIASLQTSSKITKYYWLISFSSVLLAFHGIDQFDKGVGWSGALPVMDGRITYVGIFNDPNDLGNFFVSSLPVFVYLYFNYRSILLKLILASSTIVVLYGIYLTNSRGAILGVAGMVWLYLAQRFGFVKAVVFSSLFIPVLLLAPSRVSEIDPNEASAAGRVEAWYEGLQMLIHSRFLGVGYGGFIEHHYLTAHNSFVLVFAELGLIGYFVWLSFLFLTFFMAYKKLKEGMSKRIEDRTESERLSFPAFYALVGYIITAFFLSRSYNILLYLLSAISISNYINGMKSSTKFEITFSKYFGVISAITIISLLFFYFLVKALLNI